MWKVLLLWHQAVFCSKWKLYFLGCSHAKMFPEQSGRRASFFPKTNDKLQSCYHGYLDLGLGRVRFQTELWLEVTQISFAKRRGGFAVRKDWRGEAVSVYQSAFLFFFFFFESKHSWVNVMKPVKNMSEPNKKTEVRDYIYFKKVKPILHYFITIKQILSPNSLYWNADTFFF